MLRLLAITLLACLTLAAPAYANHEEWNGDDPWETEQPVDWDEPAEEIAETTEDTGEEQPAVGQELWDDPTTDWDDPATVTDWTPDENTRPDRGRPQPPTANLPPLVKGKMVSGRVARLRADGKAAIPRGAPARVRKTIRALNEIVGKPYKWGGGHGRLIDSGYDCSGAVGYGLIRVGLMGGSMVSGQMARWGRAGKGRWISVYAHSGHVYMEVAGLRLDTSPVGDPTRRMGVRWRPAIGQRGGFATRHPAGL